MGSGNDKRVGLRATEYAYPKRVRCQAGKDLGQVMGRDSSCVHGYFNQCIVLCTLSLEPVMSVSLMAEW